MNRFLKISTGALWFLAASACHTIDQDQGAHEINHEQDVKINDGIRARRALAKQVRKMFENGKFAELDAMAHNYLVADSQFSDGGSKLGTYYTAFHLSTSTPEMAFPQYIALAEEWRRTNPTSVTAQTVLADAWTCYAWKARGGGYASEVKDEEWPLVRERLNKAWEIVNEPLAPGIADSPIRHELLLDLARVRGVERDKFEAMFQDALRKNPDYYYFYVQKAEYLLPKWHGEEGEWQRFITEVVNKNPEGHGATIYTRTAWSLFYSNDWKDFVGSGVSWARMKAGFEEMSRNYPTSTWLLNSEARFACKAGDHETLAILLKRIDSNKYYSEAWDNDSVNDCRRKVGLPAYAEQKTINE